MTAAVCTIVVASAMTHAYWNLLLKRAGGGYVLVALSKTIEALILVPILFLAYREWPHLLAGWFYPVGGALLIGINYAMTTSAYRRGDLSLAYPIARGAVLVFLPPFAFLVFGERIDWLGALGLSMIVGALVILPLPGFDGRSVARFAASWRRPEMPFAWAAALSSAEYTVCAVQAVRSLTPLTYFAAYTVIVGSVCAALLVLRRGARGVGQMHWRTATEIALFNTISYVLMLYALRTEHTSYVTGVRQLGIAFGALLGWRILGERVTLPRGLGIALLIAGCATAAFAE